MKTNLWKRLLKVGLPAVGLLAIPAMAVTYTWDSGGANCYWSTTGNWNQLSGYPSSTSDDAYFNTSASHNDTICLNNSSVSIDELKIGPNGSSDLVMSIQSNTSASRALHCTTIIITSPSAAGETAASITDNYVTIDNIME